MKIQFDPINLLAEVAGETHGISRSEIKEHLGAAQSALAAFRAQSKAGTYGFPDLPLQTDAIKTITAYAKSVKGTFDTVCVIGIGGSALGAWALDCGIRGPHPVQKAFSKAHPRLVILDNVDPFFIQAALDSMHPKKTLVVVIAKSGGTAETISAYLIVRAWLDEALGKKAKQRIVAITSEGKGDLYKLAMKDEFQRFVVPENVGGRFSVLSPVGLVPAALIGLDIRKLCKGAAEMTKLCWQSDLKQNIALRAALYHWLLLTKKKKTIQVAFPYSNQLWGTAFWFRQLWAESLGKRVNRKNKEVFTGQTPIAALGATDQHSQVQLYIEGPNDKVFTFWTVEKFATAGKIPKVKTGLGAFDALAGRSLSELIHFEQQATAAAMTEEQRPNCTFTLGEVDEEHLGALLQMLEFQTAFMGELLNIDTFNQPGVELGKMFTFALMGRADYDEYRERYSKYQKKREAAK